MSLDLDTEPWYGRFTLRTDCPRCGALLPVNAPSEDVTCDCGAEVRVPPALLGDLVEGHEERWPGRGGDAVTLGDLTWRWTAEPGDEPSCGSCGAPTEGGACPCGAVVEVSPAPELLRRSARSAKQVFAVSAAPSSPAAPVAMSCPQCGAGLSVTHERARDAV